MTKKTYAYSSSAFKKEIFKNAKSLGIAEKWAETIASQATQHVDSWIKNRGIVTEDDLRRIAYKKLKELNPDIAYIYKNRGKIL